MILYTPCNCMIFFSYFYPLHNLRMRYQLSASLPVLHTWRGGRLVRICSLEGHHRGSFQSVYPHSGDSHPLKFLTSCQSGQLVTEIERAPIYQREVRGHDNGNSHGTNWESFKKKREKKKSLGFWDEGPILNINM